MECQSSCVQPHLDCGCGMFRHVTSLRAIEVAGLCYSVCIGMHTVHDTLRGLQHILKVKRRARPSHYSIKQLCIVLLATTQNDRQQHGQVNTSYS